MPFVPEGIAVPSGVLTYPMLWWSITVLFWGTIVAVVMDWQVIITLVTSARCLLYYAIVTPCWNHATVTIIGAVEREESILEALSLVLVSSTLIDKSVLRSHSKF